MSTKVGGWCGKERAKLCPRGYWIAPNQIGQEKNQTDTNNDNDKELVFLSSETFSDYDICFWWDPSVWAYHDTSGLLYSVRH